MPRDGYKTVSLKEDVIEALDRMSKPNESRPDVIRRLVEVEYVTEDTAEDIARDVANEQITECVIAEAQE